MTIYVAELGGARAFYVDNLGFEVRADMTMGGYRGLTAATYKAPVP